MKILPSTIKASVNDPPSDEAVSELMSAWWSLTQAMKRDVTPMLQREHGLEFRDFVALNAIETGANYPGLVCQRLSMTPSTISRLIDDLVKGELIVRRLDEHDSRRVHLSLTPKGEGVLAATRSTMHQMLRRGLNTLPEAETRLFARTLQQLSVSLSHANPNHANPESTGLTITLADQEADQP